MSDTNSEWPWPFEVYYKGKQQHDIDTLLAYRKVGDRWFLSPRQQIIHDCHQDAPWVVGGVCSYCDESVPEEISNFAEINFSKL